MRFPPFHPLCASSLKSRSPGVYLTRWIQPILTWLLMLTKFRNVMNQIAFLIQI